MSHSKEIEMISFVWASLLFGYVQSGPDRISLWGLTVDGGRLKPIRACFRHDRNLSMLYVKSKDEFTKTVYRSVLERF